MAAGVGFDSSATSASEVLDVAEVMEPDPLQQTLLTTLDSGTPRRIVWVLMVVATVLLLAASVLFDDGAVTSIASPGSVLRLAMGVLALTLGGTVALVAVLEAWRPASALDEAGTSEGGADRECTPSS